MICNKTQEELTNTVNVFKYNMLYLKIKKQEFQ